LEKVLAPTTWRTENGPVDGHPGSERSTPMTPPLDRRRFVQLGLLSLAGLGSSSLGTLPATAAEEEQTLYNGIRLPSPWPPRIGNVPRDPVVPAYLTSPPTVIPMDVGRQLFVDDFLVAETNLQRTHHLPSYHASNPVLTEGMVFSDGVWYD